MRHNESYQNIDICKDFKTIKLIYRPKVKEVSLLSILKATKLKKKEFIKSFRLMHQKDIERVLDGDIKFFMQAWPSLCDIIDTHLTSKNISLFVLVRIIYNLKQSDISSQMNIKQGSVSYIEKGLHSPSSDFLLKFVVAYNIGPSGLRYLLNGFKGTDSLLS